MKAIETIYNGYRFRSRLEARWAVFFDEMGIKYEYEPEGFELSDGTRYLPDFYLPNLNYYVEVKGRNDHIKEDVLKCAKFVKQKKTALAILTNIPYGKKSQGVFWFPIMLYIAGCDNGNIECHYAFFENVGSEDSYTFIQDDFAVGCNMHWYPHRKNIDYGDISIKNGFDVEPLEDDITVERFNVRNEERTWVQGIEKALLKARQARFEHGEKP